MIQNKVIDKNIIENNDNVISLNECILTSFIKNLNVSLNESVNDNDLQDISQISDNVKDDIKYITSPVKVEQYVNNNSRKFNYTLSQFKQKNPKAANIFQKAWDFLTYAVKRGFEFILKHWNVILKLLFIVALAFASYYIFSWFLGPIKAFFDTCGKNGAAIEQMTRHLGNNAEKVGDVAKYMNMLGGGLR